MLYIEVTELLSWVRRGKCMTGIQRVTYNTLTSLVDQYGPDEIRLLAYSWRFGEYRSAPASLVDMIWKRPGRPHTVGPKQGLIFDRYSNPNSKFWRYALMSRRDSVLLIESWWWKRDIVALHRKIKGSNSPTIYRFVHDLIPIVEPRFVSAGFSKLFESTLHAELKLCDAVICNSHTTGTELRTYLKRQKISKPVHVTQLAQEFTIQPDGKAFSISSSLRRVLGGMANARARSLSQSATLKPFAMFVGTMEERKNLYRLIEIWDQLQKKHGQTFPTLVLVGRWGSSSGHIRRILRETSRADGHIQLIHGADDQSLEILYRACSFTIFLSQAEGWGLPVGESLSFTRPALASNSPALREAGGKLATYVDPEDHEQIAKSVEDHFFNKEFVAKLQTRIQTADIRKWRDYALDIGTALKLGNPEPIAKKSANGVSFHDHAELLNGGVNL